MQATLTQVMKSWNANWEWCYNPKIRNSKEPLAPLWQCVEEEEREAEGRKKKEGCT